MWREMAWGMWCNACDVMQRESLNQEIMEVMESSAANWGLKVQRYEIRSQPQLRCFRLAVVLQRWVHCCDA